MGLEGLDKAIKVISPIDLTRPMGWSSLHMVQNI